VNQRADIRLTPELLREARAAAQRNRRTVLEELEALSGLSARALLAPLGQLFGIVSADLADLLAWSPAFDRLPLPKALRRGALLFRDGEALVGVLADPFDTDGLTYLETLASEPLRLCLATRGDIQAYLNQAETQARAIEAVPAAPPAAAVESAARADVEQLSLQRISEDASPIVRLVNSTLYDALKAGASDIHLECTPSGMEVRYRIDGALDLVTSVAGVETTEQVVSRIKVMAELDIAERRVPQDGRFRVALGGRDVDVRVSIMPSIHGEDAVLRLLDKRTFLTDNDVLRLDVLGFDAPSLSTVRRLAHEPYGMLLVTGPTGSGKTTTLYAAISEINHRRDKIVTIEDPVEYELPGVLQIPVNEKKGLTFARGLRSILRHDPDKIMVGEIRDRETAEIAVQSALTGHLVLTTVHANNVFDVFSRFTHMSIDPYALTSALNGIWAQRLVRLVCPHCAVAERPDANELALYRLLPEEIGDYRFRRGTGCSNCRGSGYRGRKAIAEILTLTDRLREMIATRQPVTAIKEEARRGGTRYLRESALALARTGETTLEEVARVTLSA
jgi:general secretion pathway protein E